MVPKYSINITVDNQADFPLTFTGYSGQTGSNWDIYPAQVVQEHTLENFKEILEEIKDSAEGYVTYNMLDGENFDFVDIRISWRHTQSHPELQYSITGDEHNKYFITEQWAGDEHIDATFSLLKNN